MAFKRSYIFALACSFFAATICYCQGFENLKLSPLNNINYQQNNSEQIKPFRELFSKYNLVLLAESTHFDGATIDAQCMIMKELIDSGIINTIYTESSYLNAEKIMSILLKEGEAGIPKAKMYAASGELIYWIENDFWKYLTGKIILGKVRLVGFDIETSSPTLIRELYNEVQSNIFERKLMDSVSLFKLSVWYTHFDYFVELMSFPKEQYQEHCNFIKLVKEIYRNENNKIREQQWTLIESYLYWIYHRQFSDHETQYANLYRNQQNINISYFNSIRDSIMADIFMNDYNTHKSVKAIIKTSSYHALRNFRNNSPIENLYIGKEVAVFNDILNQKMEDKIYSICFVASDGNWGLNYPGRKPQLKKISPPKESLESYFRNCKYPFFFSSFEDSVTLNSSFIMRVVFNKPIQAKWAKIFSGVFFIKEMYPLNYLDTDKLKFEGYSNKD